MRTASRRSVLCLAKFSKLRTFDCSREDFNWTQNKRETQFHQKICFKCISNSPNTKAFDCIGWILIGQTDNKITQEILFPFSLKHPPPNETSSLITFCGGF